MLYYGKVKLDKDVTMKRLQRKKALKKKRQVITKQQPVKTGERAMRNSIEPGIRNKIVDKPVYLDRISNARGGFVAKYIKIADTLNIIESTKCMSWDDEEFMKEFGNIIHANEEIRLKKAVTAMRVGLVKAGIKRPRVVPDPDTHQVFVFKNDK